MGAIMSPADLKQLLHLAKRQPLSCAIAMDKDKQGHVLLHRRSKPKKLLAELKRQAKAEGVELDPTTLRFGRASVDGSSDSGMVTFTVNKPAPGPMRPALLKQVRPAGLQRCEIVVDEALENETDDDADEAKDGDVGARAATPDGTGTGDRGAAGHAAAAAATGGSVHGSADGGLGVPGSAAAPSSDAFATARLDNARPQAAGAEPPAAAPGRQGAAVALGAASVRARFAALGPRIADALASNLPGTGGVRAAVGEARVALDAGDLATVAQAADKLERLLDGAPRQGAIAGHTPPGQADSGAPATAAPASSSEPVGAPVLGQGQQAPASVPVTGAMERTTPALGKMTNGQVIEKGKATWEAAKARFEADIGTVLSEMTAIYGSGDPRCKAIHGKVEPIMRQLDAELAAKLGEMAQAGDPGARAAKAGEAKAVIARYQGYVGSEPMVAELDRNPFHPMALRKTADAALAALSRVVDISERAGKA